MSPTIWGLTDNRAGNTAQVRGVVERLGHPHHLKQIHYSALAHLPNLLRGRSLRGIHPHKSDLLEAPWPDVVVTAGRRLAPAALYIKRQYPQVFLVHMMSPGMAYHEFNLLALPSHDRVLNHENVVRTLGAPHHVTPEKLKQSQEQFETIFAPFPGYRIGVLIGGNTAHGKLREEDVRQLLAHITRIAGMASLLITTSRRTPPFAFDMIEAGLRDRPHYFYQYGKTPGENPYLGILAASDVVIVTGESISMCSEACSTGKPVYVYTPQEAISTKHQRFLSMLIEQQFARPLEDYDPDWRPANVLDEAGRLAEIINHRIAHRP